MIEIRMIDEAHKQDINIVNEPFLLVGKMLPSYQGGIWEYDIVYWEENERTEMCFPDENYDYDEMRDNSFFIGAYDGEKCIALAIMQNALQKYMYLYDLKVAKAYRHQGVGSALIEKAKEVSRENGYRGIYTQGQDNNLSACNFYIKSGFHIGGFDSNVYRGTTQEGKADIIFYLDC